MQLRTGFGGLRAGGDCRARWYGVKRDASCGGPVPGKAQRPSDFQQSAGLVAAGDHEPKAGAEYVAMGLQSHGRRVVVLGKMSEAHPPELASGDRLQQVGGAVVWVKRICSRSYDGIVAASSVTFTGAAVVWEPCRGEQRYRRSSSLGLGAVAGSAL